MKRFLILILFSILIPIQNSSAVSPSLDETMDFLINGDEDHGWLGFESKLGWSIKGCILTMKGNVDDDDRPVTIIYDLDKVFVHTIKPSYKELGFRGDCKGSCQKVMPSDVSDVKFGFGYLAIKNGVTWKRNRKALTHLYSNFCKGASAF